jgi:hypothetical protein
VSDSYNPCVDIAPDTKDWTWVLERPCPECGLDTRTIEPADVPALLRQCADDWVEILSTHRSVSDRPAPHIWSPLEYGCHVRDVFRIFGTRLQRMLSEDDPLFQNWDQDATAFEDRYNEQDPETVTRELRQSAEDLADRLAAVSGAAWERPGRRSDGARFTVATLARYLIHDPLHHLHDVDGRRFDGASS